MNIFLSHASEQRAEADRLALALQARGHDVFLDTDDLPAGGDYQTRIQAAIDACDLFCFLISPDSVRQGRFTLSEIGFARRRWPNPAGRVLPIMLTKVPMDAVPPYLRAVSILEPQGDFVADSLVAIESLRPREWWRAPGVLATAGIALVVLLAALGFYASRRSAGDVEGASSSATPATSPSATDSATSAPAAPVAPPSSSPEADSGGFRMPVADQLQSAIKSYAAYLNGIGFSGLNDRVTVYLYSKDLPLPPEVSSDSESVNAFYMQGNLYIHLSIAKDQSVLLREYTHHALALSAGGDLDVDQAADVESGMADYLPASFLGTPFIGAGIGRTLGLNTEFVRRLDNRRAYGAVADEPHERGAVWGAALWMCRQDVGQAVIDKAAVAAWRSTMNPKGPRIAAAFGKALMSEPDPAGSCLTQQIRRRNLPR